MGEVEVQADLAAWLLACIGEDERALGEPEYDCDAWGHWHYDRIRAECDAKRRLIEMYGGFAGLQARDCGEHRTVGPHRAWCHDCSEWCYPDAPCVRCHGVSDALRLLALPYADLPGYLELWRPQTEGDPL